MSWVILYLRKKNFYTGTGEYNAVWDEKLGLCYALVQCKCGTMVGVKVHTVQGVERLETLVGKVRRATFCVYTKLALNGVV